MFNNICDKQYQCSFEISHYNTSTFYKTQLIESTVDARQDNIEKDALSPFNIHK